MKLTILKDVCANFTSNADVNYVSDGAQWAIQHIGLMLQKYLPKRLRVVQRTYGIRKGIIHYGYIHTFIEDMKRIKIGRKYKCVVTWFHVEENDRRLENMQEFINYVDLWHTTCTETRDILIENGIPRERICVIPLGVDTTVFNPCTQEEKYSLREKCNIPQGKFIIGSFQKDGNGWGEGNDPKFVKGPDVFCDVMGKINETIPIFVVLTGPARGYVKNQLDKMRIPYMHCCVKDVNDMPNYYRILDVYLITSRSEGGPKALLEAWATGIPLVSTRVGMVHDIAHDGIDALLAEKEASDELVSQLLRVYRNDQLRQCLIRNALEQVCNYTWSSMAQVYKQYIYEKMGCKNHD